MPSLSPAQKMRAQVRGWSPELIERAEQSVASGRQIDNILNVSIEPDRIAKWLDFIESNPDHPSAQAQFIMFEDGGETGLKPTASEDGMRLSDVDIGSYGHVPDVWNYRNDLPRGTRPVPGMYMPAGYAIYDRTEVWADGVADLYEDAIRDRWIPATDLDWENREELSPEVERATGQLCAIYSTYGIAEQKIISKWLEEISYGFHEVKLFLATQVYDAGRKVESLRKRALHGSGTIGKAPLSDVSETWYSALTFTDMIIALDVVYKSYELTTFECATEWARSDFDRDLFARLAEDSKRHLEYGLKHLEWYNRYAIAPTWSCRSSSSRPRAVCRPSWRNLRSSAKRWPCSTPTAWSGSTPASRPCASCARSSTTTICIGCTTTALTESARQPASLVW